MQIHLNYRLKCGDKDLSICYDNYTHLGLAIAACYDEIDIIIEEE